MESVAEETCLDKKEQEPSNNNLSKNQLKKKKREQEYIKKREEKKAARKVNSVIRSQKLKNTFKCKKYVKHWIQLKEKEQKLKKRLLFEAQRKEEKREESPNIKSGNLEETNIVSKKPKRDDKQNYQKNLLEGIPVIIDLSFQEKMTEKEMKSLCNQVAYCHGINKQHTKPIRLTLSSYYGKVKDRLDSLGADRWGVVTHDDDYINHYPKEDLIYLTGDADTDMDQIEPK